MDFTDLIDLASDRLGGAVLIANDEFFGPKDNLLKPSTQVFIEGKYTNRGKGMAGIVRGVVVDTSYFRGNYPEPFSLEAATLNGLPADEELTSESIPWIPLLPQMSLKGDSQNPFAIAYEERVTHLRFKIYPDGGVARLRVYGGVFPVWSAIKR